MVVFENAFPLVIMIGTFWKDRIISFFCFNCLTIVYKTNVTLLKILSHSKINVEV